jgi:hypothetical protein
LECPLSAKSRHPPSYSITSSAMARMRRPNIEAERPDDGKVKFLSYSEGACMLG